MEHLKAHSDYVCAHIVELLKMTRGLLGYNYNTQGFVGPFGPTGPKGTLDPKIDMSANADIDLELWDGEASAIMLTPPLT